jgi:hypothetical protein
MISMAVVGKTRGISYMVVEDGEILDWGIKRFSGNGSSDQILEYLLTLIELGDVTTVLLEEIQGNEDTQANSFLSEFKNHCLGRQIALQIVTDSDVKKVYGNISRFEIAKMLSRQIPFIDLYLPKPKKLWESESANMLLFDAASLLKVKGLLH